MTAKIQFVTGTDTGVGKTLVSAALVHERKRAGANVIYFKPAQTGVAPSDVGDADFVASATGAETVEGVRLPAPLAPAIAAIEAGSNIDYGHVIELASELANRTDHLIVEGAGGLLVPLTQHNGNTKTMVDLIADLGNIAATEIVLVCRPSLGTLNHTALSLEAIQHRGLTLAGLVISNWPEQPGQTERTNLAELRRIAPILGLLHHQSDLHTEQRIAPDRCPRLARLVQP